MSELAKCMICGKEMNFVNGLHLKIHKISCEEYLKEFPDAKLCSDAYSENMRLKKMGNKSMSGLKHTEETKKLMRDSHLGKKYKPMSEEGLKNVTEARRKVAQTIEHRAIMSQRAFENWQNPEYRKHAIQSKIDAWKDSETAKNMLEGRHRAPNDDEILVGQILDELFPGIYKFVGDLSLWIEQLNPDFIDEANKRIIEYNGCYYHCCPICGKGTKEEQIAEASRIATKEIVFNRHGYSVLFIWTHDFYEPEKLEEKLIAFQNREVSRVN